MERLHRPQWDLLHPDAGRRFPAGKESDGVEVRFIIGFHVECATHFQSASHIITRGISFILILFPLFLQAVEKDALFMSGSPVIEKTYSSSRGVMDTLGYPGSYAGQFIMSPGDAMLMTFQMPVDGILMGVNIPIYEWGTGDQQMTVSIHRLTYPNGADGGPYDLAAVDGNGWIGGYDYDAITDTFAISGTTYEGNLEGMATNAADPLGSDAGSGPPEVPPQGLIWPDGFNAATMDPSTYGDFTNDGEVDHWINLADYGSELTLLQDDWVGVLVVFTGAGGGDDDPTGFFYKEGAGVVEPWRFLKFYAGQGGTSGNGGWHIRHWLILNEIAVELTSDRGPKIAECSVPLSPDPPICAWVSDDNPSGGPAGVDSVLFNYSVDSDTNWVSLSMSLVQGDSLYGQWKVAMPDVGPGREIHWNISATDVMGNRTELPEHFYSIFVPTEPNLFFYNATDYGSWIQDYYMYNTGLKADFWDGANYGRGSIELFENYDLIVEISGSGPSVINNHAIAQYLDSGRGDYILTGDEWLGVQTGWTDSCYSANSFQHKYLGIYCDHNDINYTGSGDQGGASLLLPVENDPISGRMYNFLGDTSRLIYDPPFSNWLDGVDPLPSTDVAYFGVSGILDESGEPTGTDTLATGIYRTHNSGSRVVFLTFDPLGVSNSPLNWVTIQPFNILSEAINWVREDNVSVNTEITLPKQYALHQNFPNPFNPVTTIRYELPKFSHVRLSVYDILGREIAVLGVGDQRPGIREVQWDASNVSSGIYFIQMQAGDFRRVKKVMVLK